MAYIPSKLQTLLTKLEKQDEELRLLKSKLEELEILKNIINIAPDMIYWKDKNYIHLGCNEQFAIAAGLKNPEEVIGKLDGDFKWKKNAEKYNLDDKYVIETGESKLDIEDHVPFANGKKGIVITNKVPLRDKEGKIIGVLGMSTDITERKKMEEELRIAKEAAEAASIAKTEFIANMSHDIRNPLTGVIGMSEILEHSLKNPEQKEKAHILHDSGKKLLSMLNDILDDIRTNVMHQNDINKETFDLYQCIQDLVELELPTIKLKKLEIIVDIDSNVPQFIINDRKKIFRILLNLLGNSIKFTPSGHIAIGVKCHKATKSTAQIKFTVADTGIGINKEFLPHVFDRFSRATSSYKGLYEGQGLGLHIAQSFVTLLGGGKITVTSEENVGTTFHFNLKCKIPKQKNASLKTTHDIEKKSVINQENREPTPIYAAQNSPKNRKPPHLLLVDDSSIALKVLESMVSSAGLEFTSVNNGENAFQLIKSMNFDLVITDIGLPDFSGIELTQRIRDYEKKMHKDPVAIIGLSGHETKKLECIAAGMNNLLIKPIPISTMHEVIHQFIPIKTFNLHDITAPITADKLGINLIDNKEAMFKLESIPLFDPKDALLYIRMDMLIKMLKFFISNKMQNEINQMKQAYLKKDNEQITNLAHKIQGSVANLGLKRMYLASQYLEGYDKNNYGDLLDKLYYQFLAVNTDTVKTIKKWLKIYG